jgi:MFS family permease
MNTPVDSHTSPHDPYASLRIANFRRFLGSSLLANVGLQMQSVAVGWEIYDRTGSSSALGLVGLVQVIPVVVLAIAAGHVADRFPRQWIVAASMALAALGSVALLAVSLAELPIEVMYGCLFVIAIGRAFHQPAKSALLPQLIPRELFSGAVSWAMTGFQLSSVLGPALGGLLLAWHGFGITWGDRLLVWKGGPATVYVLAAVATMTYAVIMLTLRGVPRAEPTTSTSLKTLVAGFSFVRHHPLILPALALDLFAVLLGGATSLLPIFAKDILKVGPTGLGWLEGAPAAGALLMAVVMAHRPPLRHAGRDLLVAVTGFGVATIVFGLSHNFWLSLAMLFCTGAVDNISVIVRHTLVQMLTPDAMRGRVSAVNGMFIGASNELGGFESGMVAAYFTPQISVVSGGVGTLLVVAVVTLVCRQLRRYGRLDVSSAVDEAEAAPRGTHHPAAAAMGSPENEPGATRSAP